MPATTITRSARNHSILVKALAAGVTARRMFGNRYAVTARSQAQPYQVERWEDMHGAQHFSCTCRWAGVHGDVILHRDGRRQDNPCGHVLVLRFWLLCDETRQAIFSVDPALQAAWERRPVADLALAA